MSFTIESGKETGLVQIGVIPKPLILCSLAAINPATGLVDSGSDVTYLTTTPALGGATLTYNGNTYLARLQGNPIEQIQAQSPQGYDIPGSINLVIADGDFTIWGTHANAFGWRGGLLTVTFVLWDIPSDAYSSNSYVWTFILDKPTIDATGVIKVAAQARQSMTRLTVPNFARQNRCGNMFPATLAQRIDGLTNPTSPYHGCGCSADLAIARVRAASFAGTGLNDLTSGGTFTDIAVDTYVVTISATGAPDSFTWTLNGGTPSSPVTVTGSSQVLNNGVTVTFAATTGHTLAASWTILGTPVFAGAVGNLTTPNLTNPDGSALTDALGNYVMCDFSRSCGAGKGTLTQGCMARLGNYSATATHGGSLPCGLDGDIANDTSGRATGRFTGDVWVAPVGWSGRQYVNSGAGTQYGFNAANPPTGSTYYSQGYGTQWVNATVLEPASGANAMVAECIVCVAQWGPAIILKVLVNGVEVSPGGVGNPTSNSFYYGGGSPGGRSSTVSQIAPINGQGDPHGSMCWFVIDVPFELAASGSLPTVQVLVQFPQCLHAYPIATAVASGPNTILTLQAGVGNNFSDGVIAGQGGGGGGFTPYVAGNSGVPNGAYIPVSVTQTTSPTTGTITIPGAWNGTGGSIFYYPTDALNSDDGFTEEGGPAAGAIAANPVWALMDLLACWGPFTVLDIDGPSWYAAAQICAVHISYTAPDNSAQTHARYRCSMALVTGQRQPLAKAVLGLRNCAGIILARNAANALLQCFIEETLADQQGSAITGSNSNALIDSVSAAGNASLTANINNSTTTIPFSFDALLPVGQIFRIGSEYLQVTAIYSGGNVAATRAFGGSTPASHLSGAAIVACGYLAYLFDGNGSIEKGTFKLGGRSLNDTPNTIEVPFQDNANAWVLDSATTIDPKAYVSSGNQEIVAPFTMIGPDNFDQVTRRSNVELAKALYGNSRFDAGGTELPSFKTTVKAAHLASRVGFICGINYAQLGLGMVLARLLSATPNTDGEHWDLAFRWHYDAWHTDAYNQNPAPYQINPMSQPPNRPPWPLKPARSAWIPSDALFSGLQTIGLWTTNGQITVSCVPPINVMSTATSAPRVPLQATIGSGGAIDAGTYLVCFVGIDAAGLKSQPSANVTAVVASGSSTITVSNIVWDSGAVDYEVYFGPHSHNMWQVVSATPVASSITIGASMLPLDGIGRPDVVENSVLILVTPIRHGGIWGDGASAIATHTISIPSTPTIDQWAGRILSLYGSATPVATGGIGPQTYAGLCKVQPANFNVTANDTSGNMTVSQATAIGLATYTFPGDAYVMRAMANIASATTIGDSAFINQFAPGGLIINAELGKKVWIMAGTGQGQIRNIASNTATTLTISIPWATIPDETSVFVILESAASLSIQGATFNNSANSGLFPDAVLAVIQTPFTVPGSQSFLVQVVTQDSAGNISPVRFAPWLEVFVPQQVASGTTVGFGINAGSTGTNVTPYAIASHGGTVSSCAVVTKVSDPSVNLAFTIRQNGTAVASGTVAAATAAGTESTFSLAMTATVTTSDKFTIDITSGTSAWQFTAQLQT